MSFNLDFRVVGIGEVLWDLLLTGKQLGGAPANFAYHSHALGAQTHMVTRVGNDEYGHEIIRRFQNMGLPDSTVQVDRSKPTGTVKVVLSGDGLAHFTVLEDVAWDYITVTNEALAVARVADAICFGSLAQRCEPSRNAIQQLVTTTPGHALRVFDINLRQQFYSREVIEKSLQLANVLKLNDDELPKLAEMFGLAPLTKHKHGDRVADQIKAQLEFFARTFDLRLVALTRGPGGSLLYQEGRWSDCESSPVQVIDTVGAGDSFTASLVLGLLRKMDLDEINTVANEIARYVCSQAGGTPPMPPEFAQRFSDASPQRRPA
jgi:fructokinase